MGIEKQGSKTFEQMEDAFNRALRLTVTGPIDLDAMKGQIDAPTISTPVTALTAVTSLPSTVVKGKLNAKVEGNAAMNTAANGDFAAGAAGWALVGATISGGEATIIASSSSSYVESTPTTPLVVGRKYAIMADFTVTSFTSGNLFLQWGASAFIFPATPLNVKTRLCGVDTLLAVSTGKVIAGLTVATATCKVDNIMLVPMTGTPYESFTADQMNAMFPMYFEGLQSVKDVRVNSVGKNLFDGVGFENNSYKHYGDATKVSFENGLYCSSSAEKIRIQPIKVKPNTNYRLVRNLVTGTSVGISSIANNYTSDNITATSNADGSLYIGWYNSTSYVPYTKVTNIQLEEGTVSTAYAPYTESEAFLPVTLSRLQNGVADSVESDGKLVKRIAEYTLTAADVTSLYTAGANIDLVGISNSSLSAIVNPATIDRTCTKISTSKTIPLNGGVVDDVASIWKHTTNLGDWNIIVPKNTYANLAAAQAALAGTKIYYQLANPITTQLLVPNLIAEPSGTLYLDNLLSDVDFYDTSIVVTGRVFSGIEKVVKIDKVTGAELDVTSTCTLTTAKDGFTSTALVKGDLVWFVLEVVNTMLPSLTYSYPLDIKAVAEGNSEAIKQVDNRLDLVRAEVDNAVKQLDTVSVGTTTLDALAQVKSVIDSYGGVAEFIKGGASLFNAVTNGDFANGTTGWLSDNGVITASNNIGKVTGGASGAVANIYRNIGTAKVGNIYYFSADVRVTNANCNNINIAYNAILFNSISNPIQNNWYRLSGVRTMSETNIPFAGIDSYYPTLATGKETEVKNIMFLNITGTPYENYTADQMNGIIGKYFEGLQGAKDVVIGSRGRNLFDKSKAVLSKFALGAGGLGDDPTFATIYIKVKPSTTYKVINNLASNTFWTDRIYGASSTGYGDGFTSTSGVSPSNAKYLALTIPIANLDTCQITEGTTAIPFEEYQGSQVTVSATRHKLNNGIEDSLEFKNGKVRFNKKIEQTPVINFDSDATETLTNTYKFQLTSLFTNKLGLQSVKSTDGSLQFAFMYGSNIPYQYTGVDTEHWYNTSNTVFIWVNKSTIDALAGATLSDKFKTWQTQNKVRFIYQLETPIIIEEKDFPTYGITVAGSLTSNTDFTEYFVDSYDILAKTDITFPSNVSKALENMKESVQGLKVSVDNKASKVQGPWITPTLLNGWVNYGGGVQNVQYMKDDFGFVHLRGVIKNGTVTTFTPLLSLPVGYKPLQQTHAAVISNGLLGFMVIELSGNVTFVSGSNLSFSIDFSFKAEA